MTINQIVKASGLPIEVSASLYWHCLWLRTASEDSKIIWRRLLNDKKYRSKKEEK